MNYFTRCYKFLHLILFLLVPALSHASDINLLILKSAYPGWIKAVDNSSITWKDGTVMPVQEDNKVNNDFQQKLDNSSLLDQIENVEYMPGTPINLANYTPLNDAGRIRYEPFFRKMYGNTPEEVQQNLTLIYWMPTFFGTTYPLYVTRVNHVDKKLTQISHELESLVFKHPDYIKYLKNPGGTFKWRKIAHTNRLSNHSFGMTLDINPETANYWQWDLEKKGEPIAEETKIAYRNTIPWEIIPIFEKYGFIWGGKWKHYDSMHFEYRPELFMSEKFSPQNQKRIHFLIFPHTRSIKESYFI